MIRKIVQHKVNIKKIRTHGLVYHNLCHFWSLTTRGSIEPKAAMHKTTTRWQQKRGDSVWEVFLFVDIKRCLIHPLLTQIYVIIRISTDYFTYNFSITNAVNRPSFLSFDLQTCQLGPCDRMLKEFNSLVCDSLQSFELWTNRMSLTSIKFLNEPTTLRFRAGSANKNGLIQPQSSNIFPTFGFIFLG